MPVGTKEGFSAEVDNDSPVLEAFRLYAAELTARHDRHERLVRISRDITTESKRIIFFLHSLKPEDRQSGLETAEIRIKALAEGLLKKAAGELYVGITSTVPTPRVLIPALEELAEAYCLLYYLKSPSSLQIPSWTDLQEIIINKQVNESESTPYLKVSPLEFMLGIMDFTGELMRQCINKASSCEAESCFTICKLFQQIYMKFLGLSYNKDLNKKMSTLKQSLHKVEDSCYKLKIRGLQHKQIALQQ